MATLPIDLVTGQETNNSKVRQLPQKYDLTREYSSTLLQRLLADYRLVIKALQLDVNADGFVRFTSPADAEKLVLLANTDKVILDELLSGDILNRINDLEQRVTALETP